MNKFYFAWPIYFYQENPFDYDHPTLIKNYFQKETSTRLIKSIQKNLPSDSQAFIFIIPAKSQEKINQSKIENLLINSLKKKIQIDSRIKIFILGEKVLSLLQKNNFTSVPVSNCGYGNVRNLILITQILFNVPFLINLDDDEIIPNQQFFEICKLIIKKIKNQKLLAGIGGLCVDEKFNPQITNQNKLDLNKNIFEQRKFFQQKLIDYYVQKKWIIPTGVIFGGINIMSQKVALKCCYDPFIPRGEDIDFVINAYFSKFLFAGFSKFNIIHKPPSLTSVQEKYKLKKDIKRFIYEKMKIEYLSLYFKFDKEKLLKILEPYPSCFLKQSEEKLFKDAKKYLSQEELDNFIKKISLSINQYLKINQEWPIFVNKLLKNKKIKELFIKVY